MNYLILGAAHAIIHKYFYSVYFDTSKSIEVVVLRPGRQAQPCLFHRGPIGVTLIQGGLLVGRPRVMQATRKAQHAVRQAVA